MNTLRYSDEIRDTEDLKIPTSTAKTAAISDKELKMAMALVEGMSEQWKPNQYHDTYREDILALVEKKVKAKETKTITMPGKEKAPANSSNVIDLVSLLQQSLGKKPAGKAAAANDEDEGETEEAEQEEQEEQEEQRKPAPKRKAPAKSAAAKTGKADVVKTAAKAAPARRKSA